MRREDEGRAGAGVGGMERGAEDEDASGLGVTMGVTVGKGLEANGVCVGECWSVGGGDCMV